LSRLFEDRIEHV
jgi:hypothetical protein